MIACLLSACNDLAYYVQSATGHQFIIDNARDIGELQDNHEIDGSLGDKLELVLEAREFASSQLALPSNGSFTRYVDLRRDYALKNLYAAPAFSTELKQWCYPIIGCAVYRGYFDEQMMLQYRDELAASGYDTYIALVPTYSTLGWFDDPVLNTYIHWPEYRLVGLLFHELAHQQIYIEDDTQFNESFAVAVEEAGLKEWFSYKRKPQQVSAYLERRQRRAEVMMQVESTRQQLARLYRESIPEDDKRRQKKKILNKLNERIVQKREHGHQEAGMNESKQSLFGGEINNASLGMLVTYNDYVPAFHAILKQSSSYHDFYDYVAWLGQLPAAGRHTCLLAWGQLANKNDDSTEQVVNEIPERCRLSDAEL